GLRRGLQGDAEAGRWRGLRRASGTRSAENLWEFRTTFRASVWGIEMEFRTVRALRGPNIWGRAPVLEVVVDLRALDRPACQSSGLVERLTDWLPALAGFLGRLPTGADLGWVLAEVTLELQAQAGHPLTFADSRGTGERSIHCVVVGYQEEAVGRAALEAARKLCLAAANGQAFDLTAEIFHLRELEYDARLGPSTAPIVRAARARGIPVLRISALDDGLFQLGHGAHQHRVFNNRIDRTSGVAESISQDKEL